MPIVDISGLSESEGEAKRRIRAKIKDYYACWLEIPESATTVTFIGDDTADGGQAEHIMSRLYSKSFMKMEQKDLDAMCDDIAEITEDEAGHVFNEAFVIPVLAMRGRHKSPQD